VESYVAQIHLKPWVSDKAVREYFGYALGSLL